LEVDGSLEAALGLEPGDAGVDGEETESESFFGDDDEADGLEPILKNPHLSHEHHNPTNHEDRGDDQLVLEDPLEVLHIHFNFIY
jgi:hypothetical protein